MFDKGLSNLLSGRIGLAPCDPAAERCRFPRTSHVSTC